VTALIDDDDRPGVVDARPFVFSKSFVHHSEVADGPGMRCDCLTGESLRHASISLARQPASL
jgi:hypothetical protein